MIFSAHLSHVRILSYPIGNRFNIGNHTPGSFRKEKRSILSFCPYVATVALSIPRNVFFSILQHNFYRAIQSFTKKRKKDDRSKTKQKKNMDTSANSQDVRCTNSAENGARLGRMSGTFDQMDALGGQFVGCRENPVLRLVFDSGREYVETPPQQHGRFSPRNIG